jgi:SAM-dependent methyltransferase
MHEYTSEYAVRYIEKTLGSPYTLYKNQIIAGVLSDIGVSSTWDFGGNVSGLIKRPGSLRYQLEEKSIAYRGVDLVPKYFCRTFATSLGVVSEELYSDIIGIVGDLRELPLVANCAESIVCADVIEHIYDPHRAFAEMYRVLQPQGRAVVVVPSLYKLDAIRVPHIMKRRYSSHENRFSILDWVTLMEEANFRVDSIYSQPIGVASGLLYLAWLFPECVPERASETAQELFSLEAILFRKVKNMITQHDAQLDQFVLRHQNAFEVVKQALNNHDILGVMEQVKEWYLQALSGSDAFSQDEVQLLTEFIEMLKTKSLSEQSTQHLSAILTENELAMQQKTFWGNSALVVLHKQ